MVTRSMFSFPSYAADMTLAMISGTASGAYPLAKLADLKRIRQVFRSDGAGAIAFSATFSADRSIGFVALVHHNATDGATWRIRCYSDAGMTSLVDDSGVTAFDISAAAQFRALLPYALPETLTVRAIRVDLSNIGTAWQVGGLEAGGLIAWDDPTKREIGIVAGDDLTQYPEGAVHATRNFSPRVMASGRQYVTHSVDGYTLLDLAKRNGRSEPFVYVRAYEDPTTHEREAILVRLRSLRGLTRHFGDFASFDLPLQEHLR